MWLFNGFCTLLQGLREKEMCERDKMNRHEQNKTPIIKYKLCTLCLSNSSLSPRFILPPYSSHTPSGGLWEGRARWSKEDLQSHSVRAMLLPAYLSRTPLLLHSHCFDANRVVGHRWLHNGEHTQCILGALLGHKWQSDQVCLKSRVHQQMVVLAEESSWWSYLCVNSYNNDASARKLFIWLGFHQACPLTQYIHIIINIPFEIRC